MIATLIVLWVVVGVLLGIRGTRRFNARLDEAYPLVSSGGRVRRGMWVLVLFWIPIWPVLFLIDDWQTDSMLGKREGR